MLDKALSVSQLNNYIKNVFEDEIILQNIQVFGELYEYGTSGNNTFFTIKEGECILPCIRFGTSQNLSIGLKVILKGSVSFYAKGGKISFITTSIEPYGEGELYADFLKLKNKLLNEGLFDNKKQLPELVKDVSIITSETGAVIHDFITVVHSINKNINIIIYPVRVQGENCELEIAQAIEYVNKNIKSDVIVIARGGGSTSDLQAFNTEVVARAVAASQIPTVSAVGHESDTTLCDFCASRRAGTPSIAGEMVAYPLKNVYNRVYNAAKNIYKILATKFETSVRKLNDYSTQIAYLSKTKLAVNNEKLFNLIRRINIAAINLQNNKYNKLIGNLNILSQKIENIYQSKEIKFKEAVRLLEKSNPLKLLSQGYTKLAVENKMISSVLELNIDDLVKIYLYDGEATARIDTITKNMR